MRLITAISTLLLSTLVTAPDPQAHYTDDIRDRVDTTLEQCRTLTNDLIRNVFQNEDACKPLFVRAAECHRSIAALREEMDVLEKEMTAQVNAEKMSVEKELEIPLANAQHLKKSFYDARAGKNTKDRRIIRKRRTDADKYTSQMNALFNAHRRAMEDNSEAFRTFKFYVLDNLDTICGPACPRDVDCENCSAERLLEQRHKSYLRNHRRLALSYSRAKQGFENTPEGRRRVRANERYREYVRMIRDEAREYSERNVRPKRDQIDMLDEFRAVNTDRIDRARTRLRDADETLADLLKSFHVHHTCRAFKSWPDEDGR